MAHSNHSIITGKFRGSLGKELVFRQVGDKTVVAKAPGRRTGDPTAAQAEVQDKFLLASRYAKAIINSEDQTMAEAYAASLKPRQNVYTKAIGDFLNPPVVKSIDTRKYKGAAGEKIVIRAIDDFRVTSVRVEIYAAGGLLLEAGDAEQHVNGIDWSYTTTKVNADVANSVIRAIAFDVPGNEGSLEAAL